MYFKRFDFGDTAVYFSEVPVAGQGKRTAVGLSVYPSDVEVSPAALSPESMVQVAFAGDETLHSYARGVSMLSRSSTLLKVERQTQFMGGSLNTYLTDGAGNEYVHRLAYDRATGVFTVNVRYTNHTGKTQILEHLSSFALGNIGIPARGFSTEGMTLHRMTSAWSRECRLQSLPFSALGLDGSWARYGLKAERWGQVGSMPNRGYFPFAAVEGGGICWGVQLEAPFSWQFEVFKERESCLLAGGLADAEFGQWRKEIPDGGSFVTHSARFTVKRTLTEVCNALVKEQAARLNVPASERNMPVIFNEYCTTWGAPSDRSVTRLIKALKPLPIDYFVIDCGWFTDGKDWSAAVGDWQESAARFPEGIAKTAEKIRAAGMRPGIWFEFETAGRDSACFARTDMLLKQNGTPVTSGNRRFLDLRLAAVWEYLSPRMFEFLAVNGFSYLKIDYNDAYGVGCDGPEAPAEEGRQVAEASIRFFSRLKEFLPDLVLENCSSGGSRIEPLRMGLVSMCSFSDAHECGEIPLVAANVSRVIPAQQSQIWAVIRKDEPDSRTVYSLCAAMLGRICLSGDLAKVTPEKIALIAQGLGFYQTVKQIVRDGDIRLIDCNVEYYRDPKGRQVYVKDLGNERLVIVHFLESEEKIKLPLAGYGLKAAFTDLTYRIDKNASVLRIAGEPYHAGAFLLERETTQTLQ